MAFVQSLNTKSANRAVSNFVSEYALEDAPIKAKTHSFLVGMMQARELEFVCFVSLRISVYFKLRQVPL